VFQVSEIILRGRPKRTRPPVTAGTLEGVSNDIRTPGQTDSRARRRTTSSALVVVTALAVTLLGGLLSPAAASPSTWQEPDNPGLAGVLLVLGGSIVGVIALIALLVYLPSMMGKGGSGDLVYSDPEWFGGPRTGVKPEAGDAGATTTGTGGSGARW
jgi:hypothetical protein